ncbi:MAG: multi-sensor signal transduction histidine kinase [Acidobacteria bacterium]|jgi:signal transduction histidine kinase|nr:multi-sensor signal transduction histidine kinase [Acidobacteriota bacterium]
MSFDSHDSSSDRQTDKLLRERERLASLNEDVNSALIREGDLRCVLQHCSRVLVQHLEVAFVRVWTIDNDAGVLTLEAGAGIDLPLDAQYSEIPIGQRKVGMIAQTRMPCLTNNVLDEPLFNDKSWIKNEGMKAFAGYPLIVEEELVGVICAFARHQLTDLTIQAMASVSNAIANGIKRKQTEESRRNLLERLDQAREDERRHLSRQLHDEVAQQLVIASIKLHRLEKRIVELLPDEHSIIADLVVAQELLQTNQQSLRKMAHILHPGVLEDFGLPEALRKFVSDIKNLSSGSSSEISLNFCSAFPRLKSTIERAIYRIAQEAVTNAVNHGAAESISLKLAVTDKTALAVIEDNGCGFDLKKIANRGIGLASMRERAEIIGAKLHIISQIGKGTKISLEVPLD